MPTDDIVFEPGQYIPYGLQGALTLEANADEPILAESISEDELFGEDEYSEEELTDEWEQSSDESDELDDALGVPNNMTVISQTFRTAPDGRQVVDVVIEVDEIVDAVRYEVRTS